MDQRELETRSLATNHANLTAPAVTADRPISVTQIRAAALLGVSDRTLRRWEGKGLIKGERVQGVKLYPFARLEQLAQGKVA